MSQRFSDAELAAEFWFAFGEFSAGTEGLTVEWFGGRTRFTRDDELRAEAQVETIKRFATLPHAHEPTHTCKCNHIDVHHHYQTGQCLDDQLRCSCPGYQEEQ